jgi:hypothetical protein
MIKPLHPTLKACHCGFIGTRSALYKHLDFEVKNYTNAKEFFNQHGEAVLDVIDPRCSLEVQLEQSLTQKRRELINNL